MREQSNKIGQEVVSRRNVLKTILKGAGILALSNRIKGESLQEEHEKDLEKIELSWSTQNGKIPADRDIQEIIMRQFFGLAQIIWREQDRQSTKPSQIQVILLPDFEPERMQVYGVVLHKGGGEVVGCAPKEIGQPAFDNRIFISLEGVRAVLKKDGVPITKRTMQEAIGIAAAHEIIHLLLGPNRPHDKKGLFSSKLNYAEKLDPETEEQIRVVLKNRTNKIFAQNQQIGQ